MSIILEGLTKRYDGLPVVNNLSLEVADGEFFVLLGSSGSGKTTALSMIAGLSPIDEGRVLLHGRDVTHAPPQERRVGFVFQNYALFEHMMVADNVEFGLRVRKVPAAERRRRCDELLELVGLAGLGGRLPRQLSGGQQQRVALARALAHQPDVLLLDEPLGALDARIRTELRRTLRAIQRQLGIATILVTHDQEEAFELADRIGVMSFGRLLEVGSPRELYGQPKTEFVATFLGTANLLLGRAEPDGIRVGPLHFPLNGARPVRPYGRRVQVLFRPEDVVIAPRQDDLTCPQLGRGLVEEIIYSGSSERLRLRLPPISGARSISPAPSFGRDDLVVEVARTQEQARALPLKPDQNVWLGVKQVHALEHPGLRFLTPVDGTLAAQAAIDLGAQMARLAQARVTLLGVGEDKKATQEQLRLARQQLGGGLAALETRMAEGTVVEAITREGERQPYDLVILGSGEPQAIAFAERLLQAGEYHVMLVPRAHAAPSRALISVAAGEPAKEDIFFAGRLARHLEASATLLAVLPEATEDGRRRWRAEGFLIRGARTLELLDVPAETVLRRGPVVREIMEEMARGGHDLLVLGAPLPDRDGAVTFSGVVGHLLKQMTDHPVLIVRCEGPGRPIWSAGPSGGLHRIVKGITA